ncbi:MAG: ATP-binding cassette domain-containing protein [Paracoccaceae bacterium]
MTTDVDQDLMLRGVGKSYGAHLVLQPTDLHVRAGEFLTIVGPSGSGKTTLLRMIAGFTEASCGTIRFQNQDLTQVPTHKRPFNTVFQDYALFPHMTVADNVGYGLMIRRLSKDVVRQKITDALVIVGLKQLLDRFPSQLSGGQKQRVALARALVCEPKVLLLDEPLSALDAEMRGQMQVFLKDLQRRVKTTFILVTHDQEEAITMSDRIAVMSAGQIEQIGTQRDVYYAPQTRFVASFFGDNNLLQATALPDGSVDSPLGHIDGPRAMGKSFIEALIYLPFIMPSIITGLSLLLYFSALHIPMSLLTVTTGHTIFVLAVVYRLTSVRLANMSPTLREASRDLGANGWETFRHVTFPHLKPAVLAGVMFAAAISIDETLITLFLSGDRMTLPIRLWSLLRVGFTQEIYALVTLVIVGTLVLALLGIRSWKKSGITQF